MSLAVFPLTFVSSAYVPVDMLPGWLQPFGEHQPITCMVDTVRSLCLGGSGQALLGHGTGHFLGPALLWSWHSSWCSARWRSRCFAAADRGGVSVAT
jgi:ABC-2 type transport system permease protein